MEINIKIFNAMFAAFSGPTIGAGFADLSADLSQDFSFRGFVVFGLFFDLILLINMVVTFKSISYKPISYLSISNLFTDSNLNRRLRFLIKVNILTNTTISVIRIIQHKIVHKVFFSLPFPSAQLATFFSFKDSFFKSCFNTFPEATLPEIINVVKEGMANYRILSQVGNQFLGDAYFSLPIAGSGGSTWSDWIIPIAVTGAIVITVGTIAYYLWKRKGPTPPGESGVSLPQKAPVKSDQSIKASSLNTFSQISIILWILSLSLLFSLCSLTTLINYDYSS